MDNISVIVSNDLRQYKQHIITVEEKLSIFFTKLCHLDLPYQN